MTHAIWHFIIFAHAVNILMGVHAYVYNCEVVAEACLFPVLLCTIVLKHLNGPAWY